MESLQFTQRETQLAAERRLKFQGTAKVNLDEIHFHSQSNRQLDQKNIDRLCNIFREEECQNLVVAHRVPAIVSRHHLVMAIQRAPPNVNSQSLLTNPESEMPHLRFLPGQLQGLHGRHRIAAGLDVLSSTYRWWAVDLYLDDIGDDLKTSLIEEYANEKPPSDGEIYRKIRQYANDGNLHGELRWKARLGSNSRIRLDALTKNTRLRHAFDGVLGIPGHRAAMRISMLHRVMAVKCDEEIAHYLNYVKDFWFSLVNDDPASVGKIDQQTVEKLQLTAPRAEGKLVHGLVLSGQVFMDFDESERMTIWEKLRSFSGVVPSLYSFFEDFKCFESWAHCLSRLFTVTKTTVRKTMDSLRARPISDVCLIQTSGSTFSNRVEPTERHFDIAYRQMWLYAMRHYPQMPRDPKRKTRLAKPANATADEYVVSDMACLARRLGFQSDEITKLGNQSPDRLFAKHALLRARKPDHFVYDDSILDSLIDRIVECFATAKPRDVSTPPPILLGPSMKRRARCGHPTVPALLQDRPLLFLDPMHATETSDRVTTVFVRRCVYLAFFGPRPTLRPGGNQSQSSAADIPPSMPMSPLFVPESSQGPGHQPVPSNLQNNGLSPSEQRSQGLAPSALFVDTDEGGQSALNLATGSTAEARRLQAEAEQSTGTTTAQLAAERERVQQETEQQLREAQEAENARLQERADDMARQVQEAEERAASQAAELERLRQEATEGATHNTGEDPAREDDEALNERLDEILHGDAEPGASGDARQEEERAMSLVQCQIEAENVPSPSDAHNSHAEPSRPVTQIDVSSLIAKWRQRRSQPVSGRAQPLRYPHQNLTRERRQSRPAGIRKSRMKERLTEQAANREGARIAAIHDDLGWALNDPHSTLIAHAEPSAAAANIHAPGDNNDVSGVANEAPSHACPSATASAERQQQQTANPRVSTERALSREADEKAVQQTRRHGVAKAREGHVSELGQSGKEATESVAPATEQALQADDEGRVELGQQNDDDGEVTARDLDDLLHEMLRSDAIQRTLGEQGPHRCVPLEAETGTAPGKGQPEEEDQVARERAMALAHLSNEAETTPVPLKTKARPAESSRPVTRIDVSDLLERWRERGSQSDNGSVPHKTDRSHSVAETFLSTSDTNEAETIPQPSTTVPAPHRQQQKAKPTKVKKRIQKAKARPRNADQAAMRAAAVGAELDDDPDFYRSPGPSAAEPGAEVTTERHQVRFDSSTGNDEVVDVDAELAELGTSTADAVMPSEPPPRPVTAYNFRRLARSAPRGPETEPRQGYRAGNTTITFYIYEQDQWKITNVLRVNPSRPSEFRRTVQGYKQRGMVLYDMKMRTVSVSSSLRAAMADGGNALLLIPRNTNELLDRRRPIQPPIITRQRSQPNE